MICEKCGAKMIEIDSLHSAGLECPNCGWGWVTTHEDPISEDNTDYEIWLSAGNVQNSANIKIIADIAGVNFLQAKKILTNDSSTIIYKARDEAASTLYKAQRVQYVARKLKDAGLIFTIYPAFPYDNENN